MAMVQGLPNRGDTRCEHQQCGIYGLTVRSSIRQITSETNCSVILSRGTPAALRIDKGMIFSEDPGSFIAPLSYICCYM